MKRDPNSYMMELPITYAEAQLLLSGIEILDPDEPEDELARDLLEIRLVSRMGLATRTIQRLGDEWGTD